MIYEQDSDGDDCWLELGTPSITSPVNGVTNVSVLVPIVVLVTPLIVQMPGLLLSSTEIEVRTAANGGGTLVWSSSSTLTIPALTLALGTTYYIRVRQVSGVYRSLWSNDIQITTSLT